MSEHRGHKQHIRDIVDRISNLPDCILHHILSFMPTKEFVKTSILSTRWKNLWAFVPNIDFDDELLYARRPPDVISFVNFVERVLRFRDPLNMEKFRLSCHFFRDTSQIHSWISDAITHNVQELDLALFGVDPSVIPRSMFGGTSLVSLKIRMPRSIELPSHVSFPCLKTLHLSSVRFLHDDFTERLFSGCPVLEELVLSDCYLVNLNNIVISSSTLKNLTIRDMSRFGACYDPSGSKIKIDATNLTYFVYFGYLSNMIILNNASSLDKAFVNIPNPGERLNEVAHRAIDLLSQLQYVVSLRLSNHTMEVFGMLIYLFNRIYQNLPLCTNLDKLTIVFSHGKTLLFADYIHFPVFQNLTHLMLTMEIEMNHTFRVLMGLLAFCPVLQSICFSEGFMRNMHLGEKNSVWSSIPVCVKNCLKTVTLKNFHGYNSEICFLKCVLKHSRVLERMDICWSQTYLVDLKRKTKVMKDLGKIERSSTPSVIKFS